MAIAIILPVSACGLFGDNRDKVREGSLTLTPLRVPQDLSTPDNRKAMRIPRTDRILMEDVEDLEKPPNFDVESANAMEDSLRSSSGKSALQKARQMPAKLESDADGHNFLIVDASFDSVWEYLDEVIKNLGFKVDDTTVPHRYMKSPGSLARPK